MRFLQSFRVFAFLVSGMFAPLCLTQCKTVTGTYKDVSYDSAKLKTPAGHGMDRKEYPFDESGAYRKDWVKSNTSGRDRSAQPGQEPTTQVASAGTGSTEAPKPGSTSYPTYAEASAARSSGNFVGPADATTTTTTLAATPVGADSAEIVMAAAPVTTASPTKTTYHKVSSGDTLFSLASRYNTSVSDLKRVNGISGDSIRSGQSLRIP